MKKLSKLEGKEFVSEAQRMYKLAADATQKMRKEALESRAFVEGNPWSDAELSERESSGRVSAVFNRTGPFVDAVTGMYVQNRQEARFLPRTTGVPAQAMGPGDHDAHQAEVLNYAADWARDMCEAEDEEADAFLDLVSTGIGATETKISFDESPDGLIDEERSDWVREMFWDPNAKRRNLVDKRWIMRIKPWEREEIENEWPDAEFSGGGWDAEVAFSSSQRDVGPWAYKNDAIQPMPRDTELVVCLEWYEVEKKHRVMYGGKPIDISVTKFNFLRPMLDEGGIPYTKNPLPTRQYFRAFMAGDTLLEKGPAPVDRFSFDVITGKRCEKTGGYYGLVRSMKDPQRWANIFYSSIIKQLSTSGKGIIAETGAFPNIHKAKEQWANPDDILEVNPGTISGGKIMPKPPSPYPEGMDRLMQQSIQAFNDVTGIPVEMLGLTQADQAGIVEAQRRQAGIAILSWAFDAMRKFRKEQARTLSKYLLTYMSDGRLVRISGKKEYVPFVKQPGMMDYDIIVDDAPTAPNQKERTWAILQNLVPYLVKMGVPPPKDMIEYLPLPQSLIDSWSEQMQPNPQQMQQQQEAMQIQKQAAIVDIKAKDAKAEKDRVEAQHKAAMIGPERMKAVTETQRNAAETGKIMAGG